MRSERRRDSGVVLVVVLVFALLLTSTVATFVRLAGEVCGDLALTLLPFGGLFLIGGMARAMAPYMGAGGFAAAFRDKGRFSGFMGQFAVTLVTDDDAALIGCARHLHGLRMPAHAG